MTKFVDCLVRLPNLRTLGIIRASHVDPMRRGLKRRSAQFPNIRELEIDGELLKFVRSCPNVESITMIGSSLCDVETLSSHAKELSKLRRIAGVFHGDIWKSEFNTFWSEASIYRKYRHGSCAGLPGPPGDLHQGYAWGLFETCCKFPVSNPSDSRTYLSLSCRTG